jgi:hypothetical protein
MEQKESCDKSKHSSVVEKIEIYNYRVLCQFIQNYVIIKLQDFTAIRTFIHG